MAMEQNFFDPEAYFESDEDVSLKQKWSPISAPTKVSENDSGSFDCNICLDSAHDPVVTLCGHLYCWPCIYKWLHVRNSSLEADQQERNCPVCKANISDASLVPLYGHGKSPSESESKKPNLGAVIPRRPPPSGSNPLITSTPSSTSLPNQQHHSNLFQSQSQSQSHSFYHQQYFPQPNGDYAAMYSSNLGGTTMTSHFNPTIGMFGEMVFARFFGNSDTSLFEYPYPNSHPLMGNSSPRMRRQEMQHDKSLSRLSIFFLFCTIVCLLSF